MTNDAHNCDTMDQHAYSKTKPQLSSRMLLEASLGSMGRLSCPDLAIERSTRHPPDGSSAADSDKTLLAVPDPSTEAATTSARPCFHLPSLV